MILREAQGTTQPPAIREFSANPTTIPLTPQKTAKASINRICLTLPPVAGVVFNHQNHPVWIYVLRSKLIIACALKNTYYGTTLYSVTQNRALDKF